MTNSVDLIKFHPPLHAHVLPTMLCFIYWNLICMPFYRRTSSSCLNITPLSFLILHDTILTCSFLHQQFGYGESAFPLYKCNRFSLKLPKVLLTCEVYICQTLTNRNSRDVGTLAASQWPTFFCPLNGPLASVLHCFNERIIARQSKYHGRN